MEVVCIQAHGDHVPGDLVEIPEGAAFSELHFALPGAPETLAAHGGPSTGEPPAGAGPATIPPLSLPGGTS